MKTPLKPIFIALAVVVAIVTVVLFQPEEGVQAPASQEDAKVVEVRSLAAPMEPVLNYPNDDHILVKEAPSEMPAITKTNTSDHALTASFIELISRHPAEKRRHEEENQWIKRREIVQVEESFQDVAKRMNSGEDVSEIKVPLFDGEMATILIDQESSEVFSEESGVIYGDVSGEEDSFVVLAYFKESDSGLINFPSRDLTIQYDPFGQNRVIVKDFDESAQSRALPCPHCQSSGTSAHHSGHTTPDSVSSE